MRKKEILWWSIPVALSTMPRGISQYHLEQIQKKQSGDIDQLFVTGCLSERYKPDLEKEMPQVDAYSAPPIYPNCSRP